MIYGKNLEIYDYIIWVLFVHMGCMWTVEMSGVYVEMYGDVWRCMWGCIMYIWGMGNGDVWILDTYVGVCGDVLGV